MRRFLKLVRLPASERRALYGAAATLASSVLGLHLLPFRVLRKIAHRLARTPDSISRGRCSPERVAWAVRAAARFVPGGGNCLAQAITGQIILARHGYPCELRIGVARDDSLRLVAHAWVESGGRALIGHSAGSLLT